MSLLSARSFVANGLPYAAVLPFAKPPVTDPEQALAIALLRDGGLPPHALVAALSRRTAQSGRLIDLILACDPAVEPALYAALARLHGLSLADVAHHRPDARLIDQISPDFCLAHCVLPWQRRGALTVIVTAYPADIHTLRDALTAALGPVTFALAPPAQIKAAVVQARGAQLAETAETRVALAESCRSFRIPPGFGLGLLAVSAFALLFAPGVVLLALTLWAVVTLVLSMSLKLAATLAALRPAPIEPASPALIARLPIVSIMVALYCESDIASRLVQRLGKIDYPPHLLDILLIVEDCDHRTRRTLARANLPSTMRVVTVPQGRVKTKPRALNFGLGQCRGSIVGVYDAEDAPEPDQITKVVHRFHQRGGDGAGLQGVLDFYKPGRNGLARCFTIEYAAWFRVILPGLQRLGLPIPLGGTTLFFRREVLDRLGGWDAHNVTEDADLGMRLARHGYRTEVLATTTYEEANCHAVPWIKQRSRWVKGYMMTYVTHMRRPGLLYRQLGPRGFLGFQVLFLASLSQALLLPLLWSYWALAFGLGHPVSPYFNSGVIPAATALFVIAEFVNIAAGLVGLHRSGQKLSPLWVPTLSLYFPLQALAAYKALWELLHCPFYWDKTSHGAFSDLTAGSGDQALNAGRKARIQATLSAPSILTAPATRPRQPAIVSQRRG